ncbi:MAG: YaeQ family protein [Polyangiales bacterium]
MALTATVYHLRVELSDVDRGVYTTLDLRPALHPSETMRYLALRTLAYCLLYSDDVAFSKGLSSTDEPAVWARTGDGRVTLWVDIGRPSIERLHKASKLGARVAVFTADAPEHLRREAAGAKLHRAEAVEVWSVDAAFVDALAALFDRNTALTLVHTEGNLYATLAGKTLEGTVTRATLADPAG